MESVIGDIDIHIAALAYGNYGEKEKAARALEAIGEPVIKPLANALRNCKRETKFYIINILGNIKGEEALAPLSWVAFGDNDYFFRRLATLALGDCKNPKAFSILRNGLEDESAHVRMAAGDALGKLGIKGALPDLEAALSRENNEQIIRKFKEAIRTIKENGKTESAQIGSRKKLKECLSKEFCEYVGEMRCPSAARRCVLEEGIAKPEKAQKKKPRKKEIKKPKKNKDVKKPKTTSLIVQKEDFHSEDCRKKTDELIRAMDALSRKTDTEIALLKQEYPQYFKPLKRSKPLKRLCYKR